MRAYELTLVLKPTLKEEERKKLLTTVKGYFDNPNIVRESGWGQKTLSYPIKKEVSGYYVQVVLEMENTLPSDLERRLLTNNNVLRHLLLKTRETESSSSAKASEDKQKSKIDEKAKVQEPKKKVSEKKAATKPKKAIKKTKKK